MLKVSYSPVPLYTCIAHPFFGHFFLKKWSYVIYCLYKMVDYKSKAFLIKINQHLSLLKINTMILVLLTCKILPSSFRIYFILLSTTRRICPKYGEIQTGMYFFCIHRRPGTMDNECE